MTIQNALRWIELSRFKPAVEVTGRSEILTVAVCHYCASSKWRYTAMHFTVIDHLCGNEIAQHILLNLPKSHSFVRAQTNIEL